MHQEHDDEFCGWACIELFNGSKIAGYCDPVIFLGTPMLKVQVPAIPEGPAFTIHIGSRAIATLTMCDEETAITVWRLHNTTEITITPKNGG